MRGRHQKKLALKKSIYIIGEGITEQYYFSHLKHLKRFSCVIKPRFFGKTSIDEIAKATEKLLLGGVTIICVFDSDVSKASQVEKEKLEQFINKYKDEEEVIICDSLPSIEFWFLLHFKKTNKHFHNSKAVERELKKFITDYNKTENYLKNSLWVKLLLEKLEVACNNAKSVGQVDGYSYSNVYKAIEKLENK